MSTVDTAVAEDERSERCRVCLQAPEFRGQFYYLFGAWNIPWEGMECTIAEDLMKSTHIYIVESDAYSKIICKDCTTKLREVCTFIQFVQNNDTLLRQYNGTGSNEITPWPKPIQLGKTIGNGIIVDAVQSFVDEIKQEILSDEETDGNTQWADGYNEEIDIKIEPVELIDTPIQDTSWTDANGVFPDEPKFEEHILPNGIYPLPEQDLPAIIKEEPLEEESIGDLPLNCLLCAKEFNSISGLKAHVIAQHSYKTVKRRSGKSPEKKRVAKYVCNTCRRNFVTSTDLMVHETCHNKAICYSCNQQFDTFKALTLHRKKKCKNKRKSDNVIPKVRTLDNVRRTPETPAEVCEQEMDVNNSDPYKCNICEQTFSDFYYLKVHEDVHNISEVLEDVNDNNMLNDNITLEEHLS